MDIREKIKSLPDSAGVYIMKDASGGPIYIGKAASLRKRVASYFRDRPLSPRLEALVDNIKDIDFIPASNEAEALLLEAGLIRSRQPKYNIALRDDKRYPLLRLTVNERFPRLLIARMRKNDGARYFGPYTEAKLLRKAVSFLKTAFPLRTCKTLSKSLCLDFYLGQCPGPCAGKTDERQYRKTVDRLVMFLEGKKPEMIKDLETEMLAASREKRYEAAARLRDQMTALTMAVIHSGTKDAGPACLREMEALRDALGLKGLPRAIEAFDVSNISGTDAVGSMVTFANGQPCKNGYRRFRIKGAPRIDDYAMIREVLQRRYKCAREDKRGLPDLIVIDGGKGHLLTAKEELDRTGCKGPALIAVAKEFERIFILDAAEPIKLPQDAPALHLVQRVRDEAHRFAISYHTSLRSRLANASALDGVKGVGPKKKTALIKYFGSVENIKQATAADLTKVKGINRQIAKTIRQRFHSV